MFQSKKNSSFKIILTRVERRGFQNKWQVGKKKKKAKEIAVPIESYVLMNNSRKKVKFKLFFYA